MIVAGGIDAPVCGREAEGAQRYEAHTTTFATAAREPAPMNGHGGTDEYGELPLAVEGAGSARKRQEGTLTHRPARESRVPPTLPRQWAGQARVAGASALNR